MADKKSRQPAEEVNKMDSRKLGVSYFTFTVVTLIVLALGFVVGQRGDQLNLPFLAQPAASEQLDTSSLQETYQKLDKKYDGKLNESKLIQGASRGLVEAADDPYTVYFDRKEAKEFSASLDGKFSGIGAEIGKKDSKLVVISPLDDSPAKRAGLLANDVIARVNDEDTSNWSIDKAVSKIKGKAGTSVKLTIVRVDEVKEISITRAVIDNPSVKTEVKGDIGVIRISRFGEDTASLMRRAANDFKDQKVGGVVVDVRGNGGGYLSSAQEVASLWLQRGQVVVSERSSDNKINETHRASGEATFKDLPTVVLIDGGSASASEILAGALQDHGVAKLVGQKSFGKGSVQQVIDLSGGAKLKVTIARWFTPNGKSINKKGITPDIKVEVGKNDDGLDKDAQLKKALKLLE